MKPIRRRCVLDPLSGALIVELAYYPSNLVFAYFYAEIIDLVC